MSLCYFIYILPKYVDLNYDSVLFQPRYIRLIHVLTTNVYSQVSLIVLVAL